MVSVSWLIGACGKLRSTTWYQHHACRAPKIPVAVYINGASQPTFKYDPTLQPHTNQVISKITNWLGRLGPLGQGRQLRQAAKLDPLVRKKRSDMIWHKFDRVAPKRSQMMPIQLCSCDYYCIWATTGRLHIGSTILFCTRSVLLCDS
ncbi:hypothetical protein K443DRAFT_682950 [Laccaria amethystina LaAM-08-1]|uniref:Unplaced genomic scaffold K443scaffold_218, whole genome shotgun sequence n=1 Tax=Laccaria amethystina LaAM-08-1 TaxID=1095629 RepID=A0A0C9X2U3_9AGAR|nr:hypothetical protein K443DRAFT_682950 [Laccaria amethystina LaAM-08-1]